MLEYNGILIVCVGILFVLLLILAGAAIAKLHVTMLLCVVTAMLVGDLLYDGVTDGARGEAARMAKLVPGHTYDLVYRGSKSHPRKRGEDEPLCDAVLTDYTGDTVFVAIPCSMVVPPHFIWDGEKPVQ